MARSSHAARLHAAVCVHQQIVSGSFPNATGLARILAVSTKTARKYISLLGETFGYRPLFDPARNGYYYPDDQKPKLVPQLTDHEIASIFLLEAALRDLKGSPVCEALESVLQKLSLMVPTGSGITFNQLASAISLRQGRGKLVERY